MNCSGWFESMGVKHDRNGTLQGGTSQGNQDHILRTIFSKVGETNRHCVEFGFGYVKDGGSMSAHDLLANNSGLNTRSLALNGWNATYFDAFIKKAGARIIKTVLTEDNVVRRFRSQGVPEDVDYVSIDVDSIDVRGEYAVSKVQKRNLEPSEITISRRDFGALKNSARRRTRQGKTTEVPQAKPRVI